MTNSGQLSGSEVELFQETRDLIRDHPLKDFFWDAGGTRKLYRQLAGLTQVQLADLIDISPATIARWEAGTRRGAGPSAARYQLVIEEIEDSLLQRIEIILLIQTRHDAASDEDPALREEMQWRLWELCDTAPSYWEPFREN